MLFPLTSAGIIIAAVSPAPAPSFFSSQLFGIIIGGVISAVVSFAGSWIIYKQQQQRDRDAYARQVEREELAYKRQLEREQRAYRRSLKNEKVERLRSSYRILLNTADAYQVEAQQLNHLPSPGNISLTGVDEAVNEVTLEGVGADVLSIFFDIRRAFYTYTAKLSTRGEGNWEDVIKHKDELIAKVEELKTAMNKQLKELEQ